MRLLRGGCCSWVCCGDYIHNTKVEYNNSITPEQASLGMEPVSTGHSNLMPGTPATSKIGVNSYYNQDYLIIKSGTSKPVSWIFTK